MGFVIHKASRRKRTDCSSNFWKQPMSGGGALQKRQMGVTARLFLSRLGCSIKIGIETGSLFTLTKGLPICGAENDRIYSHSLDLREDCLLRQQ